ncbi:MAG: fluoride efflux transporter CrcB [Pseudomonadota bacterium]|jgi:CrcB protein
MNIILVAIGGALGSICRYLTGLALQKFVGLSYIPLGTTAVNIIGSFIIGLLLAPHFINPAEHTHVWRMLVIVGFLGGFTTFSAFSGEIAYFIIQQAYLKAVIHFLLNNVLGIFAAYCGFFIATRL